MGATRFFIVRTGCIDCFSDDNKVITFGPGETFGELALLHQATAPYTAVAASDTTIWQLDRLTFRTILAGMDAHRRTLHTNFLRRVPQFGTLSKCDTLKVVDCFTFVYFADETVVCSDCTCSNAFYIILAGQVGVCHRDDDGDDDDDHGSKLRFFRILNKVRHS